MTLLELSLLNNSATISSELYCTSTSLDSIPDEPELQSTSLVTTSTTLLSQVEVPVNIQVINEMSSYVQTMSDEELARGCELLNRELNGLEIVENKEEWSETNDAKVLKIGQKQQ